MYKSMSKKVIALVVIGTMCTTTIASASEVSKDESVYVNLSTNGEVEKATVTNWLHSDSGNIDVSDKSTLNNIENIKGDEEPTKDGENLKWNVNNSDLYYRGDTEKELPLKIKIKYFLDDKEINGNELGGKSGKIRMEIELENTSSKEVKIGGETRRIYTPLTTATMVTLPVDKFKDVTVNSGSLISEGNNNVAIFPAFPGLKESLNIKDKDLDINLEDKLIIEGYVTNFELGPVMVTATTEVPDLDDLKKADSLDELKDSLNKLNDASKELLKGSGMLKDGLLTAKGKLDESKNSLNINTLQEGINLLNSDKELAQANKLIDDAYFAKNIDTSKAKDILGVLTTDNINKINILANDGKDILKNKGMIEASINTFKGLSKDENFNKLLNDAVVMKNKYESMDKESIKKLESLTSLLTEENVKNGQRLLKGLNSVKNDIAPIEGVLSNGIKNTPGNSYENKMNNFLKGMDQKLNKTNELLSDKNINSLKAMGKDVEQYGSSYLILKAMIAGDIQSGLTLEQAKGKANKYIDGVYGKSGASLKSVVNSFNMGDFSKEGMINDAKKISSYREESKKLFGELDDMKSLKPMISGIHSSLSKEGATERLSKFYVGLKNENTQKLIKNSENAFLSINSKDLETVQSLKSSLMTLANDVEENKNNIDSINKMVSEIKSNPNLIKDINKFSSDLEKSQGAISKLEKALGNINSNNIDEVKALSEKLLSMQEDLKDSEDILRITKGALAKNNVDRARELLKSLPDLENGVNALVDGSKELNEGMNKFNKEGIEKLYNAGNDGSKTVENLLETKDELVNMAKENDTFTGKDENMDGKVKFIMKTEEIKAPEKEKVVTQNEEEKGGFINWIKSLINKIFG